MLTFGLLEENENGVRLTPLGSACGSSSLSFESCLRLLAVARRIGQSIADPQVPLVLLQILNEGDIYVPLQAKGHAEGRWQAPFTRRFGSALASEIGRGAADVYEVWRRQKRVVITEAWASGKPIGDIEQQYSISPFFAVSAGVVRAIVDTTRFRLGSIFEILTIAFPEVAPPATAIDTFAKSLEFGVPAEALFMIDLPQALSRSEMLTILRADIMSAAEISDGSRQSLLARLPVELVNRLKGRPEGDRG